MLPLGLTLACCGYHALQRLQKVSSLVWDGCKAHRKPTAVIPLPAATAAACFSLAWCLCSAFLLGVFVTLSCNFPLCRQGGGSSPAPHHAY